VGAAQKPDITNRRLVFGTILIFDFKVALKQNCGLLSISPDRSTMLKASNTAKNSPTMPKLTNLHTLWQLSAQYKVILFLHSGLFFSEPV